MFGGRHGGSIVWPARDDKSASGWREMVPVIKAIAAAPRLLS
jgi:hypothetical protein